MQKHAEVVQLTTMLRNLLQICTLPENYLTLCYDFGFALSYKHIALQTQVMGLSDNQKALSQLAKIPNFPNFDKLVGEALNLGLKVGNQPRL